MGLYVLLCIIFLITRCLANPIAEAWSHEAKTYSAILESSICWTFETTYFTMVPHPTETLRTKHGNGLGYVPSVYGYILSLISSTELPKTRPVVILVTSTQAAAMFRETSIIWLH